jgi:hypothetical protein
MGDFGVMNLGKSCLFLDISGLCSPRFQVTLIFRPEVHIENYFPVFLGSYGQS